MLKFCVLIQIQKFNRAQGESASMYGNKIIQAKLWMQKEFDSITGIQLIDRTLSGYRIAKSRLTNHYKDNTTLVTKLKAFKCK